MQDGKLSEPQTAEHTHSCFVCDELCKPCGSRVAVILFWLCSLLFAHAVVSTDVLFTLGPVLNCLGLVLFSSRL